MVATAGIRLQSVSRRVPHGKQFSERALRFAGEAVADSWTSGCTADAEHERLAKLRSEKYSSFARIIADHAGVRHVLGTASKFDSREKK